MTAVVELDGVSKQYGRLPALHGVDLTLASGETVALVGHNGAGKTTLMKLVLGLISPSSGSVRVLDRDPTGRRGARARRKLGFLPESAAFHAAMTGAELLAFYARLKRAPLTANAALLQQVGLAEAAGRRVATYSKGMRQRLALAQALIGEPELLLLDEPTSGLDPESRQQVYATIDRLRAAGATILVSTHALAEIETHVDRVALLNHGALVGAGGLEELRRQAALPARVRVRVRTCSTQTVLSSLTAPATVLSRETDRLEFAVPPPHKLDLVRELSAMQGIVLDIAVEDADLEAVYHELTKGGSA